MFQKAKVTAAKLSRGKFKGEGLMIGTNDLGMPIHLNDMAINNPICNVKITNLHVSHFCHLLNLFIGQSSMTTRWADVSLPKKKSTVEPQI